MIVCLIGLCVPLSDSAPTNDAVASSTAATVAEAMPKD
jgi:hypothetical protein